MKKSLQEIWMAGTREDAHRAFDLFVKKYKARYPKAVKCLTKDREELLAFYDFPAENWQHIRTTNPIESTFATVRLRTAKTNGVYQGPPYWPWYSSWLRVPKRDGRGLGDTEDFQKLSRGQGS